jgi:SLT domain-containing protein
MMTVFGVEFERHGWLSVADEGQPAAVDPRRQQRQIRATP